MRLSYSKRPLASAFLFWGLSALFALGWIPRATTALTADSILDIFLVTLVALSLFQYRKEIGKKMLVRGLLIAAYASIGLVLAVVLRGANLYDFLLAYKFTWYLILLAALAGRPLIDGPSLERLLRLALIMFLLVYAGKIAAGSLRPTFFTENNFELLLLSLLFYASYVANGRSKLTDTGLLLLVAVISGSRSGAALAAVVVLFSFDFRTIRKPSTLALILLAAVGVAGVLYVFSERSVSGGLEQTDRYRFFLHFLSATANWTAFDYLIGASRITPMPPGVCASLSFYDVLFSYRGDGSCYSVVLHSFNLRLLFDHGLIVATIIGLLLWRLMHGCSTRQKTCVLLLLFLNGLSVSSLNSVYGALGIALVCFSGLARERYSSQPIADTYQRRITGPARHAE